MKTNRLYGILAVILLFTFGGYAQDNYTITLRCVTDGINQENVAQKCRFDGQADGITTKDFVYPPAPDAYVPVGADVTWEAVGTSGEIINVVRIGWLNREGSTNVFDQNNPNADVPEGGDKITRRTERAGNFAYSISIVIPSISRGVLTIDPVLKVGGQ